MAPRRETSEGDKKSAKKGQGLARAARISEGTEGVKDTKCVKDTKGVKGVKDTKCVKSTKGVKGVKDAKCVKDTKCVKGIKCVKGTKCDNVGENLATKSRKTGGIKERRDLKNSETSSSNHKIIPRAKVRVIREMFD